MHKNQMCTKIRYAQKSDKAQKGNRIIGSLSIYASWGASSAGASSAFLAGFCFFTFFLILLVILIIMVQPTKLEKSNILCLIL